MTTQRQIEAAVKAIAAVWESHGDGYLSPGLFETMAKAALSAAEAAAWEPIETAPADGREIDVFVRGEVDVRHADGVFWRREKIGPTHWRPRPAPPKVP